MKRVLLGLWLLAGTALALPQGGSVVGGGSTITQPDASTLNITQSTHSAVLNWQGFDIGAGERVQFFQPDANALSINRISGNASQINGALTANGRVWLLNPNGVMFGQGAQVNVGGLLATTATLNDDGSFSGAAAGSRVANHGSITASQYAALAGAEVENAGNMNAPRVTLAAAPAFALDDSGLINLAPDPAGFALRVANSGNLFAPGGRVDLITQAGLASVVNTSGVIEASGFDTDGGSVRLTGGVVNVESGARIHADGGTQGNGGRVEILADNYTRMAGAISARGGALGGNGGFVEVSSKQGLRLPGTVDTTAANGLTGLLLIDPVNITITNGGPDADDTEIADGSVLEADGGAVDFSISEQSLEALSAGTNILLEASNDITIAPLTDHLLNLAATGSVAFTADSDNSGAGNFVMNSADGIATGGAGVTIHGANINVGSINTAAAGGGAIALNTTGGTGTVTTYGNLTTNNAAITLGGDVLLPGNVNFASGGGGITFGGDVAGAYSLGLNGGAMSFNGVDIGTLSIASGGALTLNGGITTDNALDLSNAGAITLAGDSALTAINGGTRQNVTLDSGNTINGAHSLAVTGAAVSLGGAMGGSTPLTALTTNASGALSLAAAATTGAQAHTGAGGITLNGNLTTTANNVDINNVVTLGSDVQVASSGGDITFLSTVNGARNLVLNAGAGNVAVGGLVGGGTRLTTLAATGAGITTHGVRTTGAQTYTGAANIQGAYNNTGGTIDFANAVTLGGDAVFDMSGGSGNLNFANTINGAHALALTAGTGTSTFNGAVGGIVPLTQVASSGNSTFAGNVTTSGDQDYTNVTLNGATYAAGDDLSVNGATIGGNVALNSGGAAGNDVHLTGAVTGAHTLTLTAGSGDAYFSAFNANTLNLASANNVFITGGLTAANGLDFRNAGALTLQSNLTLNAGTGDLLTDSGNAIAGGGFNLATAGDDVTLYGISNVGTLTLNGSAVTLNGAVSTNGLLTVNAPLALNNNITTAAANVVFNDAVTLGADSIITTGGGSLAVHDTLDGGYNFTATLGAGNLTADEAWGGTTPLASVTASGALLTFDDVTTSGDLALTGTSVVNEAFDIGGNLSITGALTLSADLSSGGTLALNGTITLGGDSTLTSGGGVGEDITLNGNVTGPHTLSLAAGSGDIDLTGNVDVGSLDFNSGGQLTYNGGTLRTADAFLFGNLATVYLAGDTVLHAGAGSARSNVTASSANTILASAAGVDLDIFGDVVTLYDIGDTGSGKLNTLLIDANVVQLLGNIYTVGAQTINASQGLAGLLVSNGGDITLNTTAVLLSDVLIESGGGNVYFNQSISGAHHLTVDAGTGTIYVNATLGGGTALSSFSASGQNLVLAGDLRTSGDLTLAAPTTLAAGSTLATGGGNLLVGGSIDGTAYALTLDTGGGNVTLTQGGHVGSYVQNGPAGAVVWGGSGLTVDGGVNALQLASLNGALTTPGYANLQAAHGVNLRLDVGALNYSGGPAHFAGQVAGRTGMGAIRQVGVGRLAAGPVTFEGFAMPLANTYMPPAPTQLALRLNPTLEDAALFGLNTPEQE